MRPTTITAAAALAAIVAIALRRRRRRGEDEGDWTSCGGAQLVGNTPLIKLQSLSKLSSCDVYAKCEHLNPNGTGKDRLALAMIKDAEANGSLRRGGGGFIVEGSSGSTTLALAPLVAATDRAREAKEGRAEEEDVEEEGRRAQTALVFLK